MSASRPTSKSETTSPADWHLLLSLPLHDTFGAGPFLDCTSNSDCEVLDPSVAIAAHTTDAGLDWTRTSFATRPLAVTSFTCATAPECEGIGISTYALFFRTSNYGATWAATILPLTDGSVVTSLSCPTPAVCEILTDASYALRTTDGGVTWHKQAGAPAFLTSSLACASVTICIAVGQGGAAGLAPVAARTSDGGTTWDTVALPQATAGVSGISCPAADVCEVASSAYPALRTEDGGRQWTAQRAPNEAAFHSVFCATVLQCFAVGGNELFRTEDGGTKWSAWGSIPRANLDAVSCIAGARCYVLASTNTTAEVLSEGH